VVKDGHINMMFTVYSKERTSTTYWKK